MNRRGFFGRLFGAAGALALAKHLPKATIRSVGPMTVTIPPQMTVVVPPSAEIATGWYDQQRHAYVFRKGDIITIEQKANDAKFRGRTWQQFTITADVNAQ